MLGEVATVQPELAGDFGVLMEWADQGRRLKVRTNAETPLDCRTARRFGAEGIGLCRTEHMFMAQDRLPHVQDMILAATEAERRAALEQLLPMQQSDFEGIFEAMAGFPVTIRLLDPPLHEFLPAPEEATSDLMRARIAQLHEANPMLGTRGVRLGLIHPEIYEMQARAIFRAVHAVHERSGRRPQVEIMIPLVAYARELELARDLVIGVAAEEGFELGRGFGLGTMIELPRACFVAGAIARHAEFFSFGTNDLTQTSLGLSRDDVESGFLTHYLEQRILDRSPFETIDGPGVGWLVRLGAWVGREAKPSLKLGICGEHGGDPASIGFCQ